MPKQRYMAVNPYWETAENGDGDERRPAGGGDDDPRPTKPAALMKELNALKAALVALRSELEGGGREKKPERAEPAHMPVNSWMAA